jgi:hypothetical protein
MEIVVLVSAADGYDRRWVDSDDASGSLNG